MISLGNERTGLGIVISSKARLITLHAPVSATSSRINWYTVSIQTKSWLPCFLQPRLLSRNKSSIRAVCFSLSMVLTHLRANKGLALNRLSMIGFPSYKSARTVSLNRISISTTLGGLAMLHNFFHKIVNLHFHKNVNNYTVKEGFNLSSPINNHTPLTKLLITRLMA